MKIAIFGDCNSIWVKSYTKEVLQKIPECRIIIFSDDNLKNVEDYKDYNNLMIIGCETNHLVSRMGLGLVVYFLKVIKYVLKEGSFDCFHIHYVSKRKLFISNFLRVHSKRQIVTFWGSDLLRRDKKEIIQFSKYLNRVDIITVGSNAMRLFVGKHFNKGLYNKTSIVRFGVNGLESIYQSTVNIEKLREKWGFPQNKRIITIGYNGSRNQNHLKVLERLALLDVSIQERLHIVLPMTYGLSNQYLEKVIFELKRINCSYSLLLDYMSSDEIAEICHATDSFVHAQITDAFSASVQEYLCAGKLLFNPSWIQYDELDACDVYYLKYESFEDLQKKICDFIVDELTNEIKKKLNDNREKIYNISSWETLRSAWINLY